MKRDYEKQPFTKEELDTIFKRLDRMPYRSLTPQGYVTKISYYLAISNSIDDYMPCLSSIGVIAHQKSKIDELYDLILFSKLSQSQLSDCLDALASCLSNEQNREGSLDHVRVLKCYLINNGKYFGCSQIEFLHDIIKSALRGNRKDFETLLLTGNILWNCTYFRYGEKVTLLETNYDKSEVRIQRFGETESYWTIVDAIE